MNNITEKYYSLKQGRLPLFLSDCLDICDPVLAFDRIMEEIGIEKYLRPEPLHRIRFPSEDRCKVNIRYMYLMDHETPSYRAFSYFIFHELLPAL